MLTTPKQITRALDRVLHTVQKPARYTGGELNSVSKDWSLPTLRAKIALAFPDIYELGGSNLGLMILYDLINKRADLLAERVYCPWPDFEEVMRREGIPLFSLETRHPIADFDILGFSLPYEQLYTNVLTMLDLAGIPLRAAARTPAHPLVIAGGSGCYNPEPMSPFFDAIVIGEGEEVIFDVIDAYESWRAEHTDFTLSGSERVGEGCHPARVALWEKLVAIPGVYVPHFYHVSYAADQTIAAITPAHPAAPEQVLKRVVTQMPPPVTRFIVPFIDVVHNRAAIEIMRGCTRGCRFCQAGMIFRPVRERSADEVLHAVDEMIRHCGFEEVSFLSLSSSDYTHVEDLVRRTIERHGAKKLSIGLPSLRIESFSVDLMELLEKGRRRSGFTFAPEAATDRLRDVINKPIPSADLLQTAEEVYSRGWTTIKMYFMIGHPTQTLEDVQAIADLTKEVLAVGRRVLGHKAKVRIGVSTLVPKPHTPFQWVPMEDESVIRAQINLLQRELSGPHAAANNPRGTGIAFAWNNPDETLVEAFLARGDRRLANVIERAWQLGAKLEGWGEWFNFAAWQTAFDELGLDMDWYARRARPVDEVLPWEHISAGLQKQFLVEEYIHTYQGGVVDDCREHCFSCGILGYFKEQRRVAPDDAWACPPLGKNKSRQPVDVHPIPLYFNDDMSPQRAGQFDHRVPQRRHGTVARRVEENAVKDVT